MPQQKSKNTNRLDRTEWPEDGPPPSWKPLAADCMKSSNVKNTNQNHWDKLDALIANTVEPTGDDWFTCNDIQKRYDVSKTTARSRIFDMKKRNLIEEWAGGNKETGGCCVKYRLKD